MRRVVHVTLNSSNGMPGFALCTRFPRPVDNNMAAEESRAILYDLIVHSEWPLEGEPLVRFRINVIAMYLRNNGDIFLVEKS